MKTKMLVLTLSLLALAAAQARAEVKVTLRGGEVLTCESIAVARNYSYCVTEEGKKKRPVNHQEVWKIEIDGKPFPAVR